MERFTLAIQVYGLLICWFGLSLCSAPPPAPARMTFKQRAAWVVFIVATVLWVLMVVR